MDVANVKKLEEQLASARESARAALIVTLEDTLSQLRAIGFDYDYVTHQNGKPKVGRPRKEMPSVQKEKGQVVAAAHE